MEEIVGEIRDEFDQDEMPHIIKKGEHHYIMDGKALIDEVNDLLHIAIENEEVDTIAGWLLTQKMELKNGDILKTEGCEFKFLMLKIIISVSSK